MRLVVVLSHCYVLRSSDYFVPLGVHPLLGLLRGLLGGQEARRCPLQLVAVRLSIAHGISDQLSKFFWVALVDGNVLREFRVETEIEGGREVILEYRMDSWGGEVCEIATKLVCRGGGACPKSLRWCTVMRYTAPPTKNPPL